MRSYDELKALIERRGVHAEFGAVGEGWAIEQNPHELATFLARMQELGVQSVLEIGTGYKGGLSRFLAADMGWDVTTVDVQDYGHRFAGVKYRTLDTLDDATVNGQFDLLIIDGDHSYESVKFDNYYWHECHKHPYKVVAFHDILGFRDCKGVQRFWEELLFTEFGKRADVVTSPDVRTASGIGWIEL